MVWIAPFALTLMLTLTLALNPGKPIDKMWSLTPDKDDLLPPPALGKGGPGWSEHAPEREARPSFP